MKLKVNDKYFYSVQMQYGKLIVSLKREYEKCTVAIGSYGRYSEGQCWKTSFDNMDDALEKFNEISKVLEGGTR